VVVVRGAYVLTLAFGTLPTPATDLENLIFDASL
jgi:hypothetical protein